MLKRLICLLKGHDRYIPQNSINGGKDFHTLVITDYAMDICKRCEKLFITKIK